MKASMKGWFDHFEKGKVADLLLVHQSCKIQIISDLFLYFP